MNHLATGSLHSRFEYASLAASQQTTEDFLVMTIQNKPHSAKHGDSAVVDAWWYENQASIDVYIEPPEGSRGPISCKIMRREIEGWLKRNPRKAKK